MSLLEKSFPSNTNFRVRLFILHSLNSLLPPDIRIKSAEEVPLTFHAQYSATGKIYHYNMNFDAVMNPFQRLYCLHVYEKTDLSLLKQAANIFLGTHDFTSFANEAHKGCAAHDAIRTIQRIDLVTHDKGIRLEFEADGFLYKMVRNIVGTLLEVAQSKRPLEQIANIIAAKDRRKAGQAAPPHGLFLFKVHY